MKRKIRVLHLISHMNDGGAQRIVLNYLRDLNDDKDVEIKVLVYGDKTNSFCNKLISNNSYNVDYMFENIHNRYVRKAIKLLFGNILLIRYIKKYNPDIVHVHISPFLRVCLKSIVSSNVPIRLDTLHSNPYRFKGKDLYYIRKAFQQYNFIGICVTKEQVKQAKDYYGMKKYQIVYNGVDIKNIRDKIISKSDARKKIGFNNNSFLIGAIGRLDKIKRFDLLLEIFSEIVYKKKNSYLLIAGNGSEKENLLALSKKLNIERNVVFLGNIDNPIDFYCAIDVLTITSESESSSLTLLEGQICGIRAVISNGVPNESIVTNRVKKMEKNASINMWVDAILDEKYIGKSIRKIEDYDTNNISQKMKEIYINCAKENGIYDE